jgi:hypothetical protein
VVIFSDQRAGDDGFVVDGDAAVVLLDAMVQAGAALAAARWEHDLIAWLAERRRGIASGAAAGIDLGEVAWTPEHFTDQQRFVIALCEQVAARCHEAIRLRGLVARRGREHVGPARRFVSRFT